MAKEVLEMEVKSNIGEVAKDTEKLAQSTGVAKKGFKGIGTAIKGVGTAMKAAGIGLIVGLFLALKEAVERNQKAMDLMETVVSTVSTTFNQVVTVLSDVVTWVTASAERFNGLSKVIGGLITVAITPLKLGFYAIKLGVESAMLAWEDSFLGGGDEGKIAELRESIKGTKDDIVATGEAALDAGKDIYSNFNDAVSEISDIAAKTAEGITKISVKANYEQAQATVAATKAAKFAGAEFAKLNAEKLKEAELFRQIRDDETKTFAERIQANKDLKKSLEEQQKLQSEQIQKQITAAQLAVDQNANDENKLALMEAQNAQLELEETITGQLSEQKTNQVGLEKELLETQKEIRAEGLTGLERELQELQDAYDLKLEMARKSGMDTTAITKKFEAEKTQIVKSNENLKLAAISGFADSVNKIAGEQKAIAVATALMNTYLGVTEVMKDPTIPSTTMKFLAAGTVLAGGLANVQNILKQDVGSGSGGGGGNVAGSTAPAPQMMSGAFDISGGVAPEATKAYVVTDEMSNSQNQLANIRRRATI
jgi:hypothetical protein